jgi:hypothetical protein
VANHIGYDGKYIDNYPDNVNSRRVVGKLIPEYGLIPAGRKDLSKTNWDGLDAPQLKRYIIYNHIRECLPGCQTFETLEQRLLQNGIDTQYHLDQKTGRRKGISFRYQNEAFKGSSIDESFSLPRLQKELELQQSMGIWVQEKLYQGKQLAEDEELAKQQQIQQQLQREQELQRQEHVHRQRHGHRIR